MSTLDWLLVGIGIAVVGYLVLLAVLLLGGRRTEAQAIARFIPDCLVLRRRLLRQHWPGREQSLWSRGKAAPGILEQMRNWARSVIALDLAIVLIAGGVWGSAPAAPAQPAAVAQVTKLRDIRVGERGSGPAGFTPLGTRLFFFANNGKVGDELWRTDGTRRGTRLVEDVNPGKGSARPWDLFGPPGHLARLGSHLYFSPSKTGDLWRTDGTRSGTRRVKAGARDGSGFTKLRGRLYFTARDRNAGGEPWRTDGSARRTRLIRDIRPGGRGSAPSGYTKLGRRLYFSASDGKRGDEVWRTDGTAQGTRLLKDIWPGRPSSGRPGIIRHGFTRLGDRLYFFADDGKAGKELWRSDGTSKGTRLAKDIQPGRQGSKPGFKPLELVRLGNDLYFAADDGRAGIELWRTDGSRRGTKLVADIRPGERGSDPRGLIRLGDHIYFSADDGATGTELWRTDGSGPGTELVADTYPGARDSEARFFTRLDGRLYFQACNRKAGCELWRSGSSAAGAELVADIRPGAGGSYPDQLKAFSGALYFSADDGKGGREPWRLRPVDRGPVE